MDLVIPLGHGSIWGDRELKYALRSWVKHHPADPLVIGEPPRWYTGRYHRFRERGRMNSNTNAKLEVALGLVKGPFIWSADDIYLLDNPRWEVRHLEDVPDRRSSYHRACQPPGRDHELHIPVIFDPERLSRALATRPMPCTAIRSWYFKDEPSWPMQDVKVLEVPEQGWWCFSSEDQSPYHSRFKAFMTRTYPDPSPWERA